jgi:hypothetical protein
MVTSLAGEHPWLRAGRWDVLLSHPARTLLGVPASRPTPQHLRDVPVHFPEGLCTGPMPVLGGPPANERVEWLDPITGPGLWLGFDCGAPLTQAGFDTLRCWSGEKLPPGLPNRLAETIKAVAAMRDAGRGRRAGYAPLPEEMFDHRFDCRGEPCRSPARDDEVIRIADQLDLVPTLARCGGRTVLRSHALQSVTREVGQRRGDEPPLRRSHRGRIPLVRCHRARLQPWPEQGRLHRDIGQQPRMAELVNTRCDVAVSHPWRGCRVRQHTGAVPHGVRRRASGTTPLRVRIGPRFGDGFERQHVEGWPGPITPRRNPEIACTPVALGHGDAAPRECAPALMV